MDGTTRASPRVTIPFGSSTITAHTVEEATSLLLKVLQVRNKVFCVDYVKERWSSSTATVREKPVDTDPPSISKCFQQK